MDLVEFSDMTSLIYDAALDPAQWPVVLGRLSLLFRSPFADKFERTVDYRQFGGVQHGLDDADYHDVFLGFWVKRNVWGAKRPVRRAGDVVTTREMIPVDDLRRTDMYNDYLAPRGLHEGLRLDLWAGEGWIEDISFLRPWSAGAYTEAEIRLARVLLPHLQRAVAVARRLRSAEALAETGLAALDQVQTAMLLLDGRGRIVHGNVSGMALLAAADGLDANATGLRAATMEATNQLHSVLHAAAGRGGMPPQSGALRLPRTTGRPPLALIALPLRQDRTRPVFDTPGEVAMLVCIVDPLTGVDIDQTQLVSLFGLTRSEAALAMELLSGQELQEIAARSGRSIHTLRTQLAKLMTKTETGRQAELMLLLAKLPRGPQ